jgi:hypothetical protein
MLPLTPVTIIPGLPYSNRQDFSAYDRGQINFIIIYYINVVILDNSFSSIDGSENESTVEKYMGTRVLTVHVSRDILSLRTCPPFIQRHSNCDIKVYRGTWQLQFNFFPTNFQT